jgi:hypothetical protein
MGMGEKEFIDAAVRRGFVTDDQVRACLVLRDEMASAGGGETTLWDFMVFNGLLTAHQVREIQELASATEAAPPTTIPGSPPPTSPMPKQKERERVPFGPFFIEGKLGEGAMGVVYLASRPDADERVALKVLPQRISEHEEYIQRFIREAKIAVSVRHSNIANGIAYGEFNRRWYYAMEYVDGKILKRLVQEKVFLDEKRAAGIAAQIADALDAIARRGLVHRDVKPGNIIVTEQGVAKLMDLGLARSTRGEFDQLTVGAKTMGTPHYMAPEQIRGEKSLDIRADLYSLGATLYEMVTGQQPFKGKTITETLGKQLRNELEHPRDYVPDLSDEICRIIQKAMAKEPKDRYTSPADMRDDLFAVLKGEDPKAERLAAGLSMVARRPALDPSTRAQPIGDSVAPLAAPPRTASAARGGPASRLLLGIAAGFGVVAFGFAGAYFGGLLPDPPPRPVFGKFAAKLEAAEVHLGAKEWSRALAIAHEVLAAEPENTRAQSIQARAEAGLRFEGEMDRARAYVSAGDWRQAYAAYDQALKIRPADPAALAGFKAVGEKLQGDPATWAQVRLLEGHEGPVTSLTFDREGNRLASAGRDLSIRIWSFGDGRADRTLHGALKPVLGVAFSPDGRRLATAGEDLIVRVWDLSTGVDLIRFAGHSQAATAIHFAPDGGEILSASEDRTVGIWDSSTGARRGVLSGHTQGVSAVGLLQEGRGIVTAGRDGTVRIWDQATGRERRRLTGESRAYLALAVSPDGAWIAAGGEDQIVRVWETGGWKLVHALAGHEGDVTSLAADPAGNRLASGSRDGTVRIWDAVSGKELKTLRGHEGPVHAVAYHPGGASAASAGDDGAIRVWGARK